MKLFQVPRNGRLVGTMGRLPSTSPVAMSTPRREARLFNSQASKGLEKTTSRFQKDLRTTFGPLSFPSTLCRRHQSSSLPSQPDTTSNRSKSDNSIAGTLVFLFPVVTFFLGVWQVYRLQWKLGLIEDTGRKLDEDPVELPSDLRFVDRPQRLLYGVKKEIY